MNNLFKSTLLIALLLSLATASLASPYLLDWNHLQVPVRLEQAQESPLAPQPVAEPFRAPNEVRQRSYPSFTDITPVWGYRNRWTRPNPQETYDVELLANAYFNHDSQAYHFVDVVEVTTIRDGREEHEIVTNSAQNRQVSVALDNLQEGDAYRLKVFWVDGSYRVIESFMNAYTDRRPLVDEPDFLANPYW